MRRVVLFRNSGGYATGGKFVGSPWSKFINTEKSLHLSFKKTQTTFCTCSRLKCSQSCFSRGDLDLLRSPWLSPLILCFRLKKYDCRGAFRQYPETFPFEAGFRFRGFTVFICTVKPDNMISQKIDEKFRQKKEKGKVFIFTGIIAW